MKKAFWMYLFGLLFNAGASQHAVAGTPTNCSINSFVANPTSILVGTASNLSWTTANCWTASITNLGGVVPNGSISTGNLNSTTTYVLTATGSNTVTAILTVTVVPLCKINLFNANPSAVTIGYPSTLSWATSNCTTTSISNIGTVTPTSGGFQTTGNLFTLTGYTLTATGPFNTAQATATVVVNPLCSITSFTANPNTIPNDTNTSLFWTTSYCTSASISGIGPVAPISGGSQTTGNLTTTSTYTLTASAGNTVTASTTVNILPSECSIYVMGGETIGGYKHDVWTTPDGSTWTQQMNAPWGKRADYAAVVFNDGTGEKIYVMGGRKINSSLHRDVWTFNGTNWVQLPDAPWSKRHMHVAVVYNDGTGDKIYVIAGRDVNNPQLQDVWSTPDGVNWTQLPTPPWIPRTETSAVVYNDGTGDKIYVIAGYIGGGYIKDVWSYNGTTWTQLPTPPWSARGDFTSVVFNNGTGSKIYIVGGSGSLAHEMWAFDGTSWTMTSTLPDGSCVEPGVTVFDIGSGKQIYLMGGSDNWMLLKDVWSTASGTTWNQLPNASWTARYDFTPVVFCQ
jgi:hypothetical protein